MFNWSASTAQGCAKTVQSKLAKLCTWIIDKFDGLLTMLCVAGRLHYLSFHTVKVIARGELKAKVNLKEVQAAQLSCAVPSKKKLVARESSYTST